jgi:hypothetical protein
VLSINDCVPLYGLCYIPNNCCFWMQLVHFINRDTLGLANDFLSLGFLPEGTEIKTIADALQASFHDKSKKSNLDFQVCLSFLTLHN